MQVEVDQSGKIGKTNEDTVLAFSNGRRFAILIPSQVKQECVKALRQRGFSPQSTYLRLFVVCLYFLLRNYIVEVDLILIDVEYPGKNAQIKEHLLNFLRRSGIEVGKHKISFSHIGKKSNAHQIALDTFRGKLKADLVLSVEDILGEF